MIIGLLGGKGSGKDTAASYLRDAYGASLFALADELKELLRDVFGFTDGQLHGSQLEKETVDPIWGISPRQVMEKMGDALRRVYGNDYQTDRVLAQIAARAPKLAVIKDVRYAHEADRICCHGGMLWRLHYAPSMKRWPSAHSSEAQWMLPFAEVELWPDDGVASLYDEVEDACHRFGIRKR